MARLISENSLVSERTGEHRPVGPAADHQGIGNREHRRGIDDDHVEALACPSQELTELLSLQEPARIDIRSAGWEEMEPAGVADDDDHLFGRDRAAQDVDQAGVAEASSSRLRVGLRRSASISRVISPALTQRSASWAARVVFPSPPQALVISTQWRLRPQG